MLKKSVLFMVVAMLMMVMVAPTTAYAKSKNTLNVQFTTNVVKDNKYYKLIRTGVSKSTKLKVTYGGKNVTKKAKYKSSNKKAFTVSKKGVVTIKGAGKATITIKYKSKTKKLKFRATKEEAASSSKNHEHKWGSRKFHCDYRGRVTGYYWYCNDCQSTMRMDCKGYCGHNNGHVIPQYTTVDFYVVKCEICGKEKPVEGYEDVYVPANWEDYTEPYVWDGNPV